MSVNYQLASIDGEQFLTVFGDEIYVITRDTHSNFDEVLDYAIAGDEYVFDLIDVGRTIQRKFDDVTYGRVSVRDGIVHFDDDPMDNALTKAILRFLDEGLDFQPLVRFFENVMANPQQESREQFYRWIEHHEFPIDKYGNIIAYKSVQSTGTDGVYNSISSGHAFVNGVEHRGRIPQSVGDIVTMPRSEVQHDPNVACHVGLHSGTYEYARTFSGDTLMHVSINPRDVVSVPHDCTSQKVRVCRYEIIGFADKEWESALFSQRDESPFSGTSTKFRVGDWVKIHPGRYGSRGVDFDELSGIFRVVQPPRAVNPGTFAVDNAGKTLHLWDEEGTLVTLAD